MRLYTLTKRQFVLVFVSFFVAFFLTVIIGIAGLQSRVNLVRHPKQSQKLSCFTLNDIVQRLVEGSIILSLSTLQLQFNPLDFELRLIVFEKFIKYADVDCRRAEYYLVATLQYQEQMLVVFFSRLISKDSLNLLRCMAYRLPSFNYILFPYFAVHLVKRVFSPRFRLPRYLDCQQKNSWIVNVFI